MPDSFPVLVRGRGLEFELAKDTKANFRYMQTEIIPHIKTNYERKEAYLGN